MATIRQRRQPPSTEGGATPPTASALKTASRPSVSYLPRRDGSEPSFALSFSIALRVLLAARVYSAFTAPISDCDETFNYWEPTHYLQYGYGLQTWEYAPKYAIRSWTYIALHSAIATVFAPVMGDKIKIFYLIRLVLGFTSAFCEASFYRAIVENVSARIANYTLIILALAPGMYIASTAFLPSSFAMCTTSLAFVYALREAGKPTFDSQFRAYGAVLWFGLGALLGWPFAAATAIPFLIEESAVWSGSHNIPVGTDAADQKEVEKENRPMKSKPIGALRIVSAAMLVLVFLISTIMIDYSFYRKWEIVPLNIILYNVFGGNGKGPNLYGTEPWTFYILNGLLNFNVMFIAAFSSIPLVIIADRYRRAALGSTDHNSGANSLITRLTPSYLWLLIFITQPHKEERFLFVVYPLICFNAAVSLSIFQALLQNILDIWFRFSFKKHLPSIAIAAVLVLYAAASISRIAVFQSHYGAPIKVYEHLSRIEIPALLQQRALDARDEESKVDGDKKARISPKKNVIVCVGKEWYRFPSHYFLPTGSHLRFIKSDFDGLLPGHFSNITDAGRSGWGGDATWNDPMMRMNDVNREEADRYVPVFRCDFLVDLHLPSSPSTSSRQPDYIEDTSSWEIAICEPFVDAGNSNRLTRAFRVPESLRRVLFEDRTNVWGRYCALKRKNAPIT